MTDNKEELLSSSEVQEAIADARADERKRCAEMVRVATKEAESAYGGFPPEFLRLADQLEKETGK